MKNNLCLAFAAACLLGLTACGTTDFGAMKTGTQVSAAQMAELVDGRSKQADVVAAVGHPNRKSQVGAKEVWYYDFSQIGQAIVGRNISESTVFEFNAKGVLVSHYKTGGQAGSSSNPLLKAAGK